jgi:hypothetical protein
MRLIVEKEQLDDSYLFRGQVLERFSHSRFHVRRGNCIFGRSLLLVLNLKARVRLIKIVGKSTLSPKRVDLQVPSPDYARR